MASNWRQQLEILTWGFAVELQEAEATLDLERAVSLFAEAALPVVKELDKALTGKSGCTEQLTADKFREQIEEGAGSCVVYLSDDGYSRLVIDAWAEIVVGLDRSLSLPRALQAWDAMGVG